MEDKTFWEYFGFEQRGRSYTGKNIFVAPDEIEYFDKCVAGIDSNGYARMPEKDNYYKLPKTTLDNLFKYCVPKLFPKTFMMETCDDGYEFAILSDKPSGGVWCHWDKDPAQALRKAIEKAIGG